MVMRVLRLIATVNPAMGGPVHGLLATAGEMARAGHMTEVVTLDHADGPFVREFPWPVHALGPGLGRYGYASAFTDWVTRNAGRFDAAVIHGLWNHAAVAGWAGLRRAGTPYVVYAHGMMDPWFRDAYPMKHWAKQLYWWTLQGRVLRDARAVLFTSEEERRRARGVFSGPGYAERVVAYGAPDVPDRVEAQAAAFRAAAPRTGERPYLLFLGRIHPKKGCDLLVEAFARVAGRHPQVDLVIAGPDQAGVQGELRRRSEQVGVADRIHWPGMLQGEAKWGALRGADALVLPSHQENFGIVVAEAMACGTPVLISDKVNIWREVEGCGGGLVAGDTAEGTVRLLGGFLGMDEAKRRAMGRAALAGYERHFTAAAAARDLTDILALTVRERVREPG